MKKAVAIVLAVIGTFVLSSGAENVHGFTENDSKNSVILPNNKEIEKKWLIKKEDVPYNLDADNVCKYEIKQTYLCFNPEMRIREFNNGQSHELTIKDNMSSDGMVRDEININITKGQYNNLLKKQEGITINKTRYQFYEGEQLVAIDIFHGELEGLAYMEIEFKSRKESEIYKDPSWVIKDVTSDVNYKNGHLAKYGLPKHQKITV